MERKMRRHDKQMDNDTALALLKKCEYGVLSTIGKDGYPYGVPVNYSVSNNKIYFHCAKDGHKVENVNFSNKASFTAVGETKILKEEITTQYKSVVAFGKINLVEGNEKELALEDLVMKFMPEFIDKGKEYIAKDGKLTSVYSIEIEKITGKTSV